MAVIMITNAVNIAYATELSIKKSKTIIASNRTIFTRGSSRCRIEVPGKYCPSVIFCNIKPLSLQRVKLNSSPISISRQSRYIHIINPKSLLTSCSSKDGEVSLRLLLQFGVSSHELPQNSDQLPQAFLLCHRQDQSAASKLSFHAELR